MTSSSSSSRNPLFFFLLFDYFQILFPDLDFADLKEVWG